LKTSWLTLTHDAVLLLNERKKVERRKRNKNCLPMLQVEKIDFTKENGNPL
jgi:hypothetical protein